MAILYTMQQVREVTNLGRVPQNWANTGVLLPATEPTGRGSQTRFEKQELYLALLLVKPYQNWGLRGDVLKDVAGALRDPLVVHSAIDEGYGSSNEVLRRDVNKDADSKECLLSLTKGSGALGSASVAPPKVADTVEMKSAEYDFRMHWNLVAIRRTLRGDGPHALGLVRAESGGYVAVPAFKTRDSFGYLQGPGGDQPAEFFVPLQSMRAL